VNETSLARLLQESRRLSDAAHDARVEWLAAAGSTALELRLLDRLDSAGGPASPHRLARPLLCTVSDLEGPLHAMQRRAWVAEVPATRGRPAAFEIRPLGRRVLASFRLAERELGAALECVLDEQELRAAVSVLCAVRGKLQGRQRRRRPRGRGATGRADFDRPRRAPATCVVVAGAAGA
jgi:DNA-binding MarR family transcriptional regulator